MGQMGKHTSHPALNRHRQVLVYDFRPRSCRYTRLPDVVVVESAVLIRARWGFLCTGSGQGPDYWIEMFARPLGGHFRCNGISYISYTLLVLFYVKLKYSRTLRAGKIYTLSHSVIHRNSLHPWHSGVL